MLIVSCSLNPESHSRILAHAARQVSGAELVDLRDLSLPTCDGAGCYAHPAVGPLKKKIQAASAVLVATPVYNYGVSSSAKNLLELTGDAWTEKLVGFLCASGGAGSYMAVMGFANSLMLDFRCLIIPRFVYADEAKFADGKIADPEVTRRVGELAAAALRLAK
jgi:FMN reductase